MRSMKILGLCFIASLALSAVLSASASATKNPRWVICANRVTGGQWEDSQCSKLKTSGSHETRELKANETREITVEANGVQRLSSPAAKTTIICKKLKVKPGAVLIGGEPGTDAETLVYEECEIEGHPKCKINKEKGGMAKIETRPLKSTLAYESKGAEETENQQQTVTVFKPETKSVFVEIEMESEGAEVECPAKALEKVALPISGEVACQNTNGDGHLEIHELHCPEVTIKTYWLQVGGVAKEEKVKRLELAGNESTYTGQSKIKLAGSEAGQDWWIV
jgi:hypothetical protein